MFSILLGTFSRNQCKEGKLELYVFAWDENAVCTLAAATADMILLPTDLYRRDNSTSKREEKDFCQKHKKNR